MWCNEAVAVARMYTAAFHPTTTPICTLAIAALTLSFFAAGAGVSDPATASAAFGSSSSRSRCWASGRQS